MFSLACLSLLKELSPCPGDLARELCIIFVKGLEFPCLFIEERKRVWCIADPLLSLFICKMKRKIEKQV